MQKRVPLLLVIAAMLLVVIPAVVHAEENAVGKEKLVLMQGSKKFVHNGKAGLAAQPLTSIKGVTYVAARSLMKEIAGTLTYESKTKQFSLIAGDSEIRFTVGKKPYLLNGVSRNNGIGAPFVLKGTLMVPLRTVAEHLGLTVTSFPKEKKIELTWETKPIAKFSVSDMNPYAEQTELVYTDFSTHPRGLAIVDERWENNQTIFEQAGTYTVTHWVQDETGVWSDPYTVTLMVKPPNQPPVAAFNTEKDSYKMGEFIRYIDQSTDDEDRITTRQWKNDMKGFFEPGPQTITLRITDANGAVSEYSKTITIENETLYPREEFNLLYTEVGEKFTISGADVLDFTAISYVINPEIHTLIRANSPETIVDEGIYYEDELTGDVRFLIHNYNGRSKPVKVYVVVTNNNSVDANVNLGPVGVGGPNPSVSAVGRAASGRFLEARLNPKQSNVLIPSGQSRVLFPEYSNHSLKPGDVYSMYADVKMEAMLKVQVVVVDAERDLTSYLPNLTLLPSHDRHIRGTFENANRTINVNETIGDVKSRMILADNIVDTRLPGIDKTTSTPVLNAGNYGTLYTIQLQQVQPNTAILVNPRGGHYAGAFSVNGRIVYTTNNSILLNPNEVGMIYKTGDTVEAVTVVFTPASGSNLPLNLLFMPFPTQ